MKTYYVGDKIGVRLLGVLGFIQKASYNKGSNIFTNPDNDVKVIASKTRGQDATIIKIIGAKYLGYLRNDTP